MAPKKRVKHSKMQKNKPWTGKQTSIFAAVLSSTESPDKPFALILETMAFKKTANESIFNNEEIEDMPDMLVYSELLNWKLLLCFFEPKRQACILWKC